MQKSKKKRGFSLIELLAVIIIIGIVIVIAFPVINGVVGTFKNNFYNNQENTLLFSGKDYFSDDSSRLPKTTGEVTIVSLRTLLEEGYTKEILDAEKQTCDSEQSVVEVTNVSKGEYNYTAKLVCDNYSTEGSYGDWSEWSTTIPTGSNIEIESQDFYNLQSATTFYTNWTDWTDVALNDNNIRQVEDIISNTETENQTVYQYRDQQWKWYNSGTSSYTSDYYLIDTNPQGYPNRDTNQCQTWYKYYYTSTTTSGENKWNYTQKTTCPASSAWTQYESYVSSNCAGKESRVLYCDSNWPTSGYCYYTNSSGRVARTLWRGYNHGGTSCLASDPSWSYTPSDLPSFVKGSQCEWASSNTVYNYYSTYTLNAPSSYPNQDSNQTAPACKYYNISAPAYYTTGDGYSSTQPVGYTNKDDSMTKYTSWSSWSTTNPTSYSYRTIVSKNQARTRNLIKSWSGNILANSLIKTDFDNYLLSSAYSFKSINELEQQPLYKYVKVKMYRYRTKIK
jgi:type IV pilus assembly protein PilA